MQESKGLAIQGLQIVFLDFPLFAEERDFALGKAIEFAMVTDELHLPDEIGNLHERVFRLKGLLETGLQEFRAESAQHHPH